MSGEPEQACYACGATDTELIEIPGWDGSPENPGTVDLFCRDIFACYQRMEADGGVPL